MLQFWLVIFVAAKGGGFPGNAEVTAGPFPDAHTCYAAGAISVDRINTLHPEKDFRAACIPDNDILSLPGLTSRALGEQQ